MIVQIARETSSSDVTSTWRGWLLQRRRRSSVEADVIRDVTGTLRGWLLQWRRRSSIEADVIQPRHEFERCG